MTATPPADRDAALAAAREVADTVLYEGYVLYPYRASGQKNQLRWQFGVLVPRSASAAASEPWDAQTECLLEAGSDAAPLTVSVRFLQVCVRTVQRAVGGGRYRTVPSLELPDRSIVPWEEGVVAEVETAVTRAQLTAGEQVVPITIDGGRETEPITDAAGTVVGRFVRERRALTGRLRLSLTPIEGPYGIGRLRVVVENTTHRRGVPASDRTRTMHRSFIGTHVLLTAGDGRFVSLLDPPEWARPATEGCANRNTWPVLVGRGRSDVLLSSPIILYDYPEIAPESQGKLYDALEIDEILSLRTMVLTDQEKREARGTDERAAAVIDLVDTMPPEMLDKLHGAIRYLRGTGASPGSDDPYNDPDRTVPWWDPGADAAVSPETDALLIDGRSVSKGARVRLTPGGKGTDAQDLFLVGRTATVQAVFHDVDGDDHLAVTVDDDPGAEIQQAHGRFFYFKPGEVVPL